MRRRGRALRKRYGRAGKDKPKFTKGDPYGLRSLRALINDTFVTHPPAPWTIAYRERVRHALRQSAWIEGYHDWKTRGDELTANEERGGRALTKAAFKMFGGSA